MATGAEDVKATSDRRRWKTSSATTAARRGTTLTSVLNRSAVTPKEADAAAINKRVEKDKSKFGGGEILGKTLAVCGLGNIGAMVAEAASSLGMNVVGCTIVGCAGALGGGTLNHLLVGRGGPVFWMSDPRFLLFAALSSVATFYMWPAAEEWAAQRSVWGVGELTAPTLYNVPVSYTHLTLPTILLV